MAADTINFNNAPFTNSAGGSSTLNGTLTVDYTAGTVTGSLVSSGGTTFSAFSYADTGGNYSFTGSGGALGGGVLPALNVAYPDTNQAPTAVTVTSGSLLGTTLTGAQATNGVVVTSAAVVCFCSGTLIRTARGDVAVEHLAVGDLAVTTSGERRPIRWLGHRVIDCRNHPRPHEAMPVRVAAHAFGPDRPARDLWVSPGHAICVDLLGQVLIPAMALVNGTTITQEDVDHVTYWHVELDSHDILMAENMPAESYLEMGNRAFFSEADVIALDASPDADVAARTHADFCRPFHQDGPLVDVVRSQLKARAVSLGWALDGSDPFAGLHLMVDGTLVEPVTRGLVVRFAVPAGARDVWLLSATAQPCEIADSGDTRDLGACIGGLTIDDGFTAPRALDLVDPLLCVGFHYLEEGVRRWTAGRARLPAALWTQHEGAADDGFFLRVELAGPALPRWVAPADVANLASAAPQVPRLALVAGAT